MEFWEQISEFLTKNWTYIIAIISILLTAITFFKLLSFVSTLKTGINIKAIIKIIIKLLFCVIVAAILYFIFKQGTLL